MESFCLLLLLLTLLHKTGYGPMCSRYILRRSHVQDWTYCTSHDWNQLWRPSSWMKAKGLSGTKSIYPLKRVWMTLRSEAFKSMLVVTALLYFTTLGLHFHFCSPSKEREINSEPFWKKKYSSDLFLLCIYRRQTCCYFSLCLATLETYTKHFSSRKLHSQRIKDLFVSWIINSVFFYFTNVNDTSKLPDSQRNVGKWNSTHLVFPDWGMLPPNFVQ